jgi:hypothetical protein
MNRQHLSRYHFKALLNNSQLSIPYILAGWPDVSSSLEMQNYPFAKKLRVISHTLVYAERQLQNNFSLKNPRL